jgi:hypothetical protein
MRVADPHELKTHAFPVLTARITQSELSRWFPVRFHHITDPQEAAEPSRAAAIKLETGEMFVLYFGEISHQLTLRIPAETDPSRFVSSLLREVPLPRNRILWRREGTRLPGNDQSDRVRRAKFYYLRKLRGGRSARVEEGAAKPAEASASSRKGKAARIGKPAAKRLETPAASKK